MFLAHICDNAKQSLKDHCYNSAEIAQNSLREIGLDNTSYLAALFHDCGKANDAFQQYLIDSFNGKPVKKGSVIHSFAGENYFLNQYHNTENVFARITSEILAYSIGSHHGLFDICDPDMQNGFKKRLAKQPNDDKKSADNFLNEVIDSKKLSAMFSSSVKEIEASLNKIAAISNNKAEDYLFYLGLLCRTITSAVMNGDRTDTANFSLKKDYNVTYEKNRWWLKICENISLNMQNFRSDTVISKSRRELSDMCYAFASNDSGIYRLNIPTGGGKTLSALRYAAVHSLKKRKSRIFYIAPLISILEQNADEIKKAVGEKYVLEHHSDVIVDSDDYEELDLRKYLEDSWSSPVIATTLAQFLNTIFSAKTSSVRRFQSICNSVIIIDEVQSVPSKMISLFNLAINFLSRICNCTILLCSATQPCLEAVDHSMIIDGNIINESNFKKYSEIFKRNRVIDCGNYRLEDIPKFVIEKSGENRSLLVVCNKKAQAEFLFESIKNDVENCCHLSAGMCVAHRKNVLKRIRELLSKNESVVCVSTQVIEAGVDISFDCAIRFSAGMDNIIQTAGRCNRNGENSSDSPVYIVHCCDENLKMLSDIQAAKQATDALIVNYKNNPTDFSDDLASADSIDFYYHNLYANYSANHFDYPIKSMPSLFEMLSDNIHHRNLEQTNEYFLCQSFKTAGNLFNVFDSDSKSVIVPYDDGAAVIDRLQTFYYDKDYQALQKEIKHASQYSVSVFDYQFKKLSEQNAIASLCDGSFYTLSPDYYDENTGLLNKPKEENLCNILIL